MRGTVWRVVEAQHVVSTMKLVDTTEEQALLEELIDGTKPPFPQDCRHLHFLFFTPFRYSKFPSRFRKASSLYGVYYAAEAVETALSEITFHRLLRFGDAPSVPWPDNPIEFTAFSARIETARCLDLTEHPFDQTDARLSDPTDYSYCQQIAQEAQEDGVEAIRSASVRDPDQGANISLLSCGPFRDTEPASYQNWYLRFSATGVQAISGTGAPRLMFLPGTFDNDPRMQGYHWERPT